MHQQEKTFEWHEAWKTLEKEWQIAATKGQQELLRIADIVQRTTYAFFCFSLVMENAPTS
jgi:hypothetical protein